MNITFLLAIGLLIVTSLLTILFIKHRNLRSDFRNYNPNPVFGPGRYNYGRDLPKTSREVMLESVRKFLTFRWTWYWTTEKYRKQRRTKKEFTKLMMSTKERKKKAKLLSEMETVTERNGSHVTLKIGNTEKLRKDFKTSGTEPEKKKKK